MSVKSCSVCVFRNRWRLPGKAWTRPKRRASNFTLLLMTTTTTFCHHQRLQSLLSQLLPAAAVNPRTKTRSSPPQGPVAGCVEPRPKLSLSLLRREKCLKDFALVLEDEELPKTLLLCLPPRPVQIIRKPPHQRSSQIPPNLQKPRLLPEITRPSKPGLHQTAPIPVQCLRLLQCLRLAGNNSVKGRRRARTPKQAERRKRGRLLMKGVCLSHRWNPAAQWTISQKMMTAKTKAPCLRPPPAPDRLASVSQQMAKSCAVWLKTLHQPKCCGSFRGGWSPWSRIKSQEGGGGEEAALEVEVLQRRPQWRRTLLDLLTNQTKTTRRRAPTANLKGLIPNLLRTKTLPRVRLCSRSLSEVIPHIPHHTCHLTCLC